MCIRDRGWNPTKTSFEELVKIMVEHDMEKVAVERAEENIRCNLEEYLSLIHICTWMCSPFI